MIIAAGLAPVCVFFAPKGITPLVALTAASGLVLFLVRRHPLVKIDHWIGGTLVLAAVWSAVSSLWSIEAAYTLVNAAKLTGSIFAGILLITLCHSQSDRQQRLVAKALMAGFAVALGLILVEVMFRGPINEALRGVEFRSEGSGAFWMNNCASLLSLLVWPIAALLWRRYGIYSAILIYAATTATVLLLDYRSGAVALLVGGVAAGLTGGLGRRGALLIAGAFALYVMTAPILHRTVLQPTSVVETFGKFSKSAYHRLHIWKFTADRIAERPIRGWGHRTSRFIPGGKEEVTDNIYGLYKEKLPLHPHSATLQVWLELGLPGAVLLGVLVVVLALRISTKSVGTPVAASGMGQLATGFVVINLSYGVWQSWLMASLWLSAAMMVLISDLNATGTGTVGNDPSALAHRDGATSPG